jgi:5-methylcytosine-specific restriction enzyme subunit McrC
MIEVRTREWSSISPENCPALRGVFLPKDDSVRTLVGELTQDEKILISEGRDGLSVETTSYVGGIDIGPLRITIEPKIVGAPFIDLLRYGYGLNKVSLFSSREFEIRDLGFQDLVISQFHLEARDLIARGLHRKYAAQRASLQQLAGRIDFVRLAGRGGMTRADVPCEHYPRLADNAINRTIKAGLAFGASRTGDVGLRSELKKLGSLLDDSIKTVPFDRLLLRCARRMQSRLTRAYSPIISLAELMLESSGAGLESDLRRQVQLPGFLFDMNKFFQNILSRFLRENLRGYKVIDEYRIKGMISYLPRFNPKNLRAPSPRPDYVVQKNGAIVAILDAKYRDIWANNVTRDILYQLSIYALSQQEARNSIILYPSLHPRAEEERIEIADPLSESRKAGVIVRPVNISFLHSLVTAAGSYAIEKNKARYAENLISPRWRAVAMTDKFEERGALNA